ncbi:uncharacterized protein LOC121739101 [Aricia agestis]|uniref:uncharacterized protein LOC121739101 n=1 Tax=Aricia agestis TaxID=91739 RepID=UPI001C2067FA|nr:uncharacterized protein LOC121739101 [Aricia agestis]
MLFFVNKLPSVFIVVSLVLLANAQKPGHREVDVEELARQNQITTKILEAFIQKKLGLTSTNVRAPSIFDIIPAKKPEDRLTRDSMGEQHRKKMRQEGIQDEEEPIPEERIPEETENSPEYVDILADIPEEKDQLQSVDTEHIDSIFTEGRSKKYSTPPSAFDNNLESSYQCSSCSTEDELGVTRWTMPLLKSGEKRYYLGIFFKANWFKAQQYCRFHGMHLASISSQEENDKLEKYVRESGYGREHFWTSGTDLAEEGNFFWMANGRPLTFVNWNAGEPNNFRYENGEEENCLELWNRDDKGLKWNDSPCSFETYFICEVRSD